jgi:NTE family protein
MTSKVEKRINVALQGGGSHGAYAWGVLDRLLADERIEIEAISGTSAGAMNAVVLAEGMVEGGRAKARQQLADFWGRVGYRVPIGSTAGFNWDNGWSKTIEKAWGLDQSPALTMFSWWTQVASPYQFNPLNINPLRDLLLREVDFDKVRGCSSCIRLFITATNVRTGQIKVFTGDEVTVDAVLASACLPTVFQAVEIGADVYWDGGYMGNPAIEPFFKSSGSADVLLVQINPIHRDEVPRSAHGIVDRLNEISFNAPLLRELRHVEFVNGCLRRGELKGGGYREIFLHRVGGGDDLTAYPASSKLEGDIQLIMALKDLGHKAMDAWLANKENYDSLGQASTMPLDSMIK